MIELITATPGSGKTLYILPHLKARSESENRQVYYHGIELKPKGIELLKWIEFDPKDWQKLPPEAILVVDEAQHTFPIRRSGSFLPEYVEQLTEHRHSGVDIYLITQHPTLIDAYVRRLVGRHTHFVRIFGASAAQQYTWHDSCQDNPNTRSARANCLDTQKFIYPKEVYDWYVSADAHTHKLRIPRKIWFMLFLMVVLIVALYFSVKLVLSLGGKAEKTASSAVPGSAQTASMDSQAKRPMTKQEYLDSLVPRVPGTPESAPRYDGVAKVERFPHVAACIASSSKCTCYTQQGTAIRDMPDLKCRELQEHGWFNPYGDGEGERYAGPVTQQQADNQLREPVYTPLQEGQPARSPVRAMPQYRGHEIVAREPIPGREPFGGGFKSMTDG